MKTCDDCKYAEWERTAVGRLHPSKNGKCGWSVSIPRLPEAFAWVGGDPIRMLCGGQIKRGREHKDHCAYWARKEAGR